MGDHVDAGLVRNTDAGMDMSYRSHEYVQLLNVESHTAVSVQICGPRSAKTVSSHVARCEEKIEHAHCVRGFAPMTSAFEDQGADCWDSYFFKDLIGVTRDRHSAIEQGTLKFFLQAGTPYTRRSQRHNVIVVR